MRLLISFLLVFGTVRASCPSGYNILWKETCVKSLIPVVYGNIRNVTDHALTECAKDGGFPAKVDSEEAINFLHSQWLSGVGTKSNILGVVCDTQTKKFKWADGTAIQTAVPSVACDSNTLFFMAQDAKIESSANSFIDSYGYGIWCYAPPTELITSDDCYDFDVTSTSDGSIGSCVKIASLSTNLQSAESECEADFSTLASIHSKQTNDYLRRQAASMGYLNGLLIGGSVSRDTFSWLDNSTVDYTNFAPGFPLPGAGSCIAMQTNSVAGQWINADCSKNLPFACSRQPDAQAPACGSTVYKEGDIFYSPGYPKNASEPCDFVLEVAERKIVQLEILNLEANECCDHLTLYEGTVGGRLIAKFSGGNLNGKKFRTFASNIMHVSWQPNGGENVRGFSATFRGL